MVAKDGGPAFPTNDGRRLRERRRLRDYFAGQVLAGWGEAHHVACPTYVADWRAEQLPYAERMARYAYEIADAMLAARNHETTGDE